MTTEVLSSSCKGKGVTRGTLNGFRKRALWSFGKTLPSPSFKVCPGEVR